MDRESMELVLKHIPMTTDPLSERFPLYMLIETGGSRSEHDAERLNAFLESSLESRSVADGTVATDATRAAQLWRLRETISEALNKTGHVYKYDISVPTTRMYNYVEDMRERVKTTGVPALVVGYGHLGDGNLHLNVSTSSFNQKIAELVEPYVFERVASDRGSISAEHGLGQAKARYIHLGKSPLVVSVMRDLKNMFDPKGILNPYKMLPARVE